MEFIRSPVNGKWDKEARIAISYNLEILPVINNRWVITSEKGKQNTLFAVCR